MTIDFLAVLIAALSSVVLAFLWYHPKVFGSAWMRLAGITPELAERGKRRMPLMMALALVSNLIVAYVMSYFSIAWGVFDWIGAVELGFWCWLGFAAPPMLGQVLWEQKSFKFYLINAIFWLVSFIVMALILVF